MDITFKDKKLGKIFNSKKRLRRKYGDENAKLIRRRMMVLKGANVLEDVPHTKPMRRHQLSGDLDRYFAVDLKQPARLIFAPNHNPLPKKEDGGLDLTKITAIKIIKIEGDYH
jgi:proteic killer suppression protein